MYHRLAQRAADMCVNHEWIPLEQRDWCAYAVEKRINTLSMFVLLALIAVPFGKVIETVVFFGSVTVLRRRIGGWHASAAWSCQLISIASVLLAVFVIGPSIEHLALLSGSG